MYFEIAAISAVVLFAILVFFIVQTLLRVQKTLQRLEHLALEWQIKSQRLDSILNTISNIGDICENKSAFAKQELLHQKELASTKPEFADDLADWLLASIKIGTKIITRKK